MESRLLLKTLRAHRVEIKYLLLALLVEVVLCLMLRGRVLSGVEASITAAMDRLAQHGAPGMFLIGLLTCTTLVIQVPYNLPMFTLILYADSVGQVVLISSATAAGAGIGEVASYAAANVLLAHVEDIEDSALFRWTKRQIERRPALIPFLVWFVSAVPIPDVLVLLPVAMVRYPWRRLIVPMVSGKLVQNNALGLLFYYAAASVSGLISSGLNIDAGMLLVALFAIVMAYQIEKTRLARRQAPAIPS